MKRLFPLAALVFASAATPAFTQEIAGNWLGKMNTGLEHPTALVVSKGEGGALAGETYILDQGIHPTDLTEVQFKDHVLTFKQGGYPYRGEMSADGQHIVGILELGPRHIPLSYERSKPGAWSPPANPHTRTSVTVDDGVKLEVLDFGGSGPPVLFLAGLGADAHVFDFFAPRFTAKHHVYALTRRGFGGSDKPDPVKTPYDSDRLSSDVLQVMTALKLDKPALVAWSMGGAEASGVAVRAPDRIAGRVYLESGYEYSLYTPGVIALAGAGLAMDANDMREKLRKVNTLYPNTAEANAVLDDLLSKGLAELKADLEATQKEFRAMPAGPGAKMSPAGQSIMDGLRKFGAEKGPVLAVYALPGLVAPNATAAQREGARHSDERKETAAKAFEAAYPDARVVRVPNGEHNVFNSNPDEVFREVDAFLDRLPR